MLQINSLFFGNMNPMSFRTFILVSLLIVLVVDSYAFQADGQRPSEIIMICHQPMYVPGDTVFFSVSAKPTTSKRQIITMKLGKTDSTFVHSRFVLDDGSATGHFVIPESIQAGQYTLGMLPENSAQQLQWFTGEFRVFDRKHTMSFQDSSYTPQPIEMDFTGLEKSYSIRSAADIALTVPLESSAVKFVSVICWNAEVFEIENRNRNIIRLVPGPTQERKLYMDGHNAENYLEGRALLKSGEPVPNTSLITFYLHRSDFIYSVNTNKDGYFTFPLFKEFESEEIFYSISHNGFSLVDATLSLIDYSLPDVAWNSGLLVSGSNPYGTYTYEREIIIDSYEHYLAKRSENMTRVGDSDDWSAEIVVEMDKYEPFKSMTEVFVNVVPMVRYKKTKAGETLRVFLQKTAMLATESPLFIVDGIMTDNFEYVMSLNPTLLERIGVLRSEYELARYGDLGAHGIIFIETSVPDHSGILPRTSRTINVTGISSFEKVNTNQFFNFSSHDERVPDLRPVLYWYSGKPADEKLNVKFITSDDVGKYILQIYIVDQNGVLHTASSAFQVVSD
jgi:hypothetical protein